MYRIVDFGERPCDGHELESDEFKTALFETAQDFTDKTALDAIGLDDDESTLRHCMSISFASDGLKSLGLLAGEDTANKLCGAKTGGEGEDLHGSAIGPDNAGLNRFCFRIVATLDINLRLQDV